MLKKILLGCHRFLLLIGSGITIYLLIKLIYLLNQLIIELKLTHESVEILRRVLQNSWFF